MSWSSILFGKYFTPIEMIAIIDKVESDRQTASFGSKILDITFAQQLRNEINGIETPPAKNMYKQPTD